MSSTPQRARPALRAVIASVGVALVAGLAALAWVGGEPPIVGPPAPPRFSLLAVGDTGNPKGLLDTFRGQAQVARAMDKVDRRDPVQALVLLGDNFYPDGLPGDEVEERLRENLVDPYCRFVTLTARGRSRLAAGCDVDAPDRHPVPIHAVLGNHDYNLPDSPGLQRDRIPEYVSNWSVPQGRAEVVELGSGISLILVDTMPLVEGRDADAVVAALKRSRGPWRIVAAHHPFADPGDGWDPRAVNALAGAFAEAGVPVQLYLSGHEHNLQVIAGPPPGPALNVVVGSGSSARSVDDTSADRRYARESLGFARVDLLELDGKPGLCVSVYAVGTPRALARPRLVSRWFVDAGGALRELPLSP